MPFEFIVASSDTDEIKKDYVINPNNILTKINLTMEYDATSNTRPDQDLALVEVLNDVIKITFVNYRINVNREKRN